MPIITLTTDFGTRDGYVGALHGVFARLVAPDVRIVDIAHDIPPGDVAHAAWVVWTACREFPEDTIHVVVVDPGVGTSRDEIVVRAGYQWFIGPNNGSFSYLAGTGIQSRRLQRVDRSRTSATFHGRDVFAPVAAAFARGDAEFDGELLPIMRLPWGERPDGQGRIVHVDRFGNLITDLPGKLIGAGIAVGTHQIAKARTYGDVAPGQLLAYVGSAGTVEIAIRDGRADTKLGVTRGELVTPLAALDGPYR